MELLPNPKFKDRVHYGVALLLTLMDAALAALALYQFRWAAMDVCAQVSCGWFIGWIVSRAFWWVVGALWIAYVIWVEHEYRTGVTRARVWKAQGQEPSGVVAERAVARWLWNQDLYLVAVRFLRLTLLPVSVYVVASVIRMLLRS